MAKPIKIKLAYFISEVGFFQPQPVVPTTTTVSALCIASVILALKQTNKSMKYYTFKELAMLYFPGGNPHYASNQLRSWINNNVKLHKALKDAHSFPRQRCYTPLQVSLIFQYLGIPEGLDND